jgi:N-acetyl-anhydromuramyl-L-alanine amidase AmpD
MVYEMAIQWRGPVPASNHTVGRDGNTVQLIVDHWTVVAFDGAIRRFKNPAGILSAHYVIASDGRIAQLVNEDDTAYHAGVFSVNQRSIGIEHEAGPAIPPTDALYAASARLHADIASRHSLRLEVGGTVLPHRAIVPTECPGTLDLDRIVRQALEEDDMFTEEDRRKLNRVYDHLEAYEPLTWTKRLQLWLARALTSGLPTADLSGPDVETGQAFDAKTASRR